jgi:DNA-binding transcriptional regulator WhiA
MSHRNVDKKILAYVIGVALGDGNLSNPNGRAVRLRITCDAKYPKLIQKMRQAIQTLLPDNKVSIHPRTDTYTEISCYSNQWHEWLTWKSGFGPKYIQHPLVPQWIKQRKIYSIHCLRGLIETDGSIYKDRGYTMVNFTTVIPELADDAMTMIQYLGYDAHKYKIPTKNKTRYTIRIAKNVEKFIMKLQLIKN